jgi:ABC-type uncharacterized transport system substrate-binding protein
MRRRDFISLLGAAAAWPLAARAQQAGKLPIVVAAAGDPVEAGLVASLARPGGNVTGLSAQTADLAAKRLEILREVVPGLRRLAILSNVGNEYVGNDLVLSTGRAPPPVLRNLCSRGIVAAAAII